MLREYLISEAMHALGIPTTRSLAVALTGEPVFREETLQGAVLTRVASSHLRVGTFELFSALGDAQALRTLVDYTLRRHYPERSSEPNPALALLEGVVERQSALVAQWMRVGFVHGVMNTDNVALSGETLDYGPCAFIDAYDPATVFSSIDRNGRYAYGQQPHIAQWNLARLAEAMLPLFHEDEKEAIEIANGLISRFEERFQHHWLTGMRAKLGLFNEESEDKGLIQSLLDWMQETKADFTNTFRDLTQGRLKPTEWHLRWSERLKRQPQSASEVADLMCRSNPAFIPRNHKVEEALAAASDHGDLNPLQRLLTVLTAPLITRRIGPSSASLLTWSRIRRSAEPERTF
jgi:uncharacterized protein YdiU (UPF0061 family)